MAMLIIVNVTILCAWFSLLDSDCVKMKGGIAKRAISTIRKFSSHTISFCGNASVHEIQFNPTILLADYVLVVFGSGFGGCKPSMLSLSPSESTNLRRPELREHHIPQKSASQFQGSRFSLRNLPQIYSRSRQGQITILWMWITLCS
jgi:hypothetical protein